MSAKITVRGGAEEAARTGPRPGRPAQRTQGDPHHRAHGHLRHRRRGARHPGRPGRGAGQGRGGQRHPAPVRLHRAVRPGADADLSRTRPGATSCTSSSTREKVREIVAEPPRWPDRPVAKYILEGRASNEACSTSNVLVCTGGGLRGLRRPGALRRHQGRPWPGTAWPTRSAWSRPAASGPAPSARWRSIYPDGVFYQNLKPEDAERIVDRAPAQGPGGRAAGRTSAGRHRRCRA